MNEKLLAVREQKETQPERKSFPGEKSFLS